jgi:phosphoribosylformylglycinamidine (FGAM) synthase-like enzyme
MAEACRVLNSPVIGGNVSLYNENAKGAIYPTPVVGMVGLIHDLDHITTQGFKNEGDLIILLGDTKAELGGSEFQYILHGVTEGRPPQIDLQVELNLHRTVLAAIQLGLVASAHDLSEGGLAVALAESCISGGIGAEVSFSTDLRSDIALFSESQSRILLSAKESKLQELITWISQQNVPFQLLGTVKGKELYIRINAQAETVLQSPIIQLEKVWKDAIPCLMNA